MGLMPANEAFKKSDANDKKFSSEVLNAINDEIEIAIEEGLFEVTIHQTLERRVQAKLEEAGYKVEYHPDDIKHEDSFTVSWGHLRK